MGLQSVRRRAEGGGSLLVVALLTAAVLGVGSLVLQRWVAQTLQAAIVMVIAWFVVVMIAILIVLRERPGQRTAALATLAATVIAAIAIGYWTGFRETTVNEAVAVAAAKARGAERAQALAGDSSDASRHASRAPKSLARAEIVGVDGHDGSGSAEVVAESGGERVLTLTDLDVDPGPDVDVLVSMSSDNIDDAINLGDLKGSNGNQQYSIPTDVDLGGYSNVVLYCNTFTVRIAIAELDA
jgi:hypothetical protein